jgi:hypothetical protein
MRPSMLLASLAVEARPSVKHGARRQSNPLETRSLKRC